MKNDNKLYENNIQEVMISKDEELQECRTKLNDIQELNIQLEGKLKELEEFNSKIKEEASIDAKKSEDNLLLKEQVYDEQLKEKNKDLENVFFNLNSLIFTKIQNSYNSLVEENNALKQDIDRLNNECIKPIHWRRS